MLAAYAYDNLGRVTSITRGNGVVTGFDYDAASRLTELTQDLAGTANDQTLSFTYNAAGQIASRTMANDIYAFTGHVNQDVTITVDGLNRFLSGGGVTYSYDSRGNMTADGVRAYAYDFDNRLTSVTGGGTGNVSLTYDPAGRLYQTAQVSGATTRFLYDGANLIGEYDASNTLLRRYVQGPGLDAPLVRYDGTGTSNRRWLITDERGSVVAETNASGAAVQINTYDEYGMPGSGNTSRFGYTGQMWIAEIGLYHYRNRVYNPRIGRFMQTDPIGQQGGINLYAYVGNDPVNYADPWGLQRDVIVVTGIRVQCPYGSICDRAAIQDFMDQWRTNWLDTAFSGGPGGTGPGAETQEGEERSENECSQRMMDVANGMARWSERIATASGGAVVLGGVGLLVPYEPVSTVAAPFLITGGAIGSYTAAALQFGSGLVHGSSGGTLRNAYTGAGSFFLGGGAGRVVAHTLVRERAIFAGGYARMLDNRRTAVEAGTGIGIVAALRVLAPVEQNCEAK